jgi:SAM-dependent methyltransferase
MTRAKPDKTARPVSDYDASTYGERIAEFYDSFIRLPKNVENAVDFLAALAGRGRALELGIGTGRIAIPLAARGMRAKSGGEGIPVTIEDFAGVPVKGQFSLIFVVFNTFFCLLTQEEQLRCFARVAKRLSGDGAFVIEAFVPDLTRVVRGQRLATIEVSTNEAFLDATIHDRMTQRIRGHIMAISANGVRLYPIQLRYAFPSELDLMARLAGMRLRERFGGWKREPFTATSETHVSVYELAPPAVRKG